jgi:uncharacterized repeat protein (TIGR01451 family)
MDLRNSVAAAMTLLFSLGMAHADAAGSGAVTAANPAIPMAAGAHIGISKQLIYAGLSAGSPLVKARFMVANYGDQDISNIAISDDLNAVYGAGNFVHVTDPNQLNGEGSLNYNANFDGNSDTALIAPGSALAPGEFVIFEIATRVTVLSDQGSGLGIYQNQVTVTGTDPAMNPVSDVSTEGPNPDPDGNDDPGDNSVVSQINLANISAIGAAKTASVAGNVVTFDLYLEAFGASTLNALTLNDDLETVFGQGNYSITSPLSLVVDPGTLLINGAFDGSADTEILAPGSSLAAAATAQIQFQVTVFNIVNRGAGLGNYSNQATATSLLANGVVLTDRSDAGTDPDPNGDGDPTGASENDATSVVLPITAITGVAKSASIAGSLVTLDFYLRNYGAGTSNSLTLVDDLDAVFGVGNYVVTGAPTLVDDPGTLVLNAGYDGGAQTGLLSAGSFLVAGDTAQIRIVVDVTTVSDAQGYGFGVYQNQARVTGADAGGLVFTDLSDEGTNPDSNNNNDPSGFDEDTPTSIIMSGVGIGAALQSYVNGTQITLDYTVENLGGTPIATLSLTNQYLAVFGFGNYSKVSGPTFIEDPGTVTLNSSFDGLFSPTVISSGTLAGHARARIRVVFNVTNVTNQGSGFGVYPISYTVNATTFLGTAISDVSDEGIVTDTNGNGNAGDPGENDVTISVIGEESILGAALQASLLGTVVTYDVYLENLGLATLSNVSVLQNLDSVFGAGNYTVSSLPAFVVDPGSLTLNAGFDGSGSPNLLSSGTLSSGATAQVRFAVTIVNPADVGLGFGVYSNRALASGMGPSTFAADFSDDGTDPDPNGNGNPDDVGEFDPTVVYFSSPAIGVAKQATVAGSQVTFDYVVQNIGNISLTQISLPDDLDAVFGAGNYQIVTPPTLISPPRNLVANAAFNGAGNNQLVVAGGSMDPSVAEQIRVVVQVLTPIDQGAGLGVYTNQVTGSSAEGVSDLSDSGSDPDPNANGNAGDPGENDPTVFQVATADLSISISDGVATAVPGTGIIYTTTATNISGATATNVVVTSNFAAILTGCSSTATAVGGASGHDPGPQLGNLNDTGITLPVGATVTYTTTCSIPAAATGSVVSSVSIAGDALDPILANNNASDTDTLLPQADVAITKTDGTVTAVPGTSLTYTIVVSNSGPSDAPGVTVLDTFPAVLTSVNYTASAVGGATGFTAAGTGNINDLVNLPAGSSITYVAMVALSQSATGTLVNTTTATVPMGVTDPTPGNNSATDTDTLSPQADLAITKTDGSPSAVPGAPVTYTIVASNSGPSVATAATITDTFAGTLSACSWTCSGTGGGTCTAASGGNIADSVNIPAAASVTYSATCTIAAAATGTLVNTATVAAAVGTTDPTPGNNSATDSDTLIPAADLSTTLTDTPDPIVAGNNLSYAATLSNAGLSDAQDVNLSLPLPAPTTFVSATPSAGGNCVTPAIGANGSITCTWLGATVPGAAGDRSVSIVALVPAATPDSTVLSATVTVASVTTDPTAGNNTATTTTTVNATADLAMALSATPDPVTAGTNLSYTAEVTNNGLADAQTLMFSLPLPTGTSLVLATPSAGGSCNAVSPVVCSWAGATTPATVRSATIEVLVDPAQTAALSATATASSTTLDPVSGNDTATANTAVLASADLSITLTAAPDPVVAGNNLSYTATVTNGGPSNAADVSISLPLPVGTSFVSATPSAGGSCNALNPVVCVWAGATAPLAAHNVDIVVLVAPSQTAALSATATAFSATSDPVPGNDTATVGTTVLVSADLSITLSDAPDPVVAGTNLTYTATITNAGPSDATAATINLPLPAGTTLVSGSVSGGGACIGAPVLCSVTGNVAPGATRTATIVVAVAPSVLTGSVLSATATVAAGSADPNLANNVASTTTSVITSADLLLGFSASASQVAINVPVSFTATSLNQGPSDAQDVSITVTLTPDFRYSSHTATGASCTTPQVGSVGAIVCTWAGATAPGVTRTLQVVAFSNVEGATAVNASTSSSTPDPVANNNLSSLAVQVGYLVKEIPASNGLGLLLLGLIMGMVGFLAIRRQS